MDHIHRESLSVKNGIISVNPGVASCQLIELAVTSDRTHMAHHNAHTYHFASQPFQYSTILNIS